jgi:hypothetical protein
MWTSKIYDVYVSIREEKYVDKFVWHIQVVQGRCDDLYARVKAVDKRIAVCKGFSYIQDLPLLRYLKYTATPMRPNM